MLQSVQNQVKCCYNLEITTSSEGSECLIQFYLCLMSGSHCFIATALQCARTENRLENEGFCERFRKQKQINNVPLKLTKYRIKYYWIFSVKHYSFIGDNICFFMRTFLSPPPTLLLSHLINYWASSAKFLSRFSS